MNASRVSKLVAAAAAVALIGGGLVKLLGAPEGQDGLMFGLGLLLGTLFGGLLLLDGKGRDATSSDAGEDAGSGNIYVGNLPFNAGEDDIRNIFSPFGTVIEIRMVKDRRSKRFKGYAFVEMDVAGAALAIEHLDNTDYAGRTLRVNEAKKRADG